MARKILLIMVLIISIGVTSYAGENQDKRKRKAQERIVAQQEVLQAKERAFRAEEEFFREIQDKEQALSQLRRKLFYMHEDNVRKYGPEQHPSEELLDYIEQHQPYNRDRR